MTNKYYQKRKEILRKEGRERYQNLSEEEKDKRQKWSETDIKVFRKGKQKLLEYKKNYYLAHKKVAI